MAPTLTTALQNYANTNAGSMKAIFETMVVEPAFNRRVRSWLRDCGRNPERCLDAERASTAVCDIISLQLCCYEFSIVDQELVFTDLGGATTTLQILLDFLRIVAIYDIKFANYLAGFSHTYASQRLRKIKKLISMQA